MRTLKKLARAALVFLGALMLNLLGGLATTASAATIFAQTQAQTNNGPNAPGFVFFLLLVAIFVAVLAFSFKAYQDASR
jgi:uncharacterized membrane protein YhaH (DUF805 family)